MNSIFHFSYFDPDYPTSGLTVTKLARVCYIYTSIYKTAHENNCADLEGHRNNE
jgi:hypothetical protein